MNELQKNTSFRASKSIGLFSTDKKIVYRIYDIYYPNLKKQ